MENIKEEKVLSLEADEIVTLISSDGKKFEITQHEIEQSEYLTPLIDELYEIQLKENSDIVEVLVKFMKHHSDNPMKQIPKPIYDHKQEDVIDEWDRDLVKDLSIKQLARLVDYSSFVSVSGLFDLACGTFAYRYTDKDLHDQIHKEYFEEFEKHLQEEAEKERQEIMAACEVNKQKMIAERQAKANKEATN